MHMTSSPSLSISTAIRQAGMLDSERYKEMMMGGVILTDFYHLDDPDLSLSDGGRGWFGIRRSP